MNRYLAAVMLCLCIATVSMSIRNNQSNEDGIVRIEYINDKPYVDAQQLSLLGSDYRFDKLDKQLQIQIEEATYLFIEQVPVVQKNGSYIAIEKDDFVIKDNIPFLSTPFLKNELSSIIRVEAHAVRMKQEVTQLPPHTVEVTTTNQYSFEEVREYFQSLTSPLKGAHADTFASHIPGAPRTYRYGYHEGLDWYTYSAGMIINQQTPVYAMGEGKVVRIDHDYKGYSSIDEREEDLQLCQTVNKTPAYILDKLRGRQVWIEYDNGVQARFAHLSNVSPNLHVGDLVDEHTFVGFVGNSGTSGEVQKDQSELHLHVDLLIRGTLFWEGLESQEVKQIIKETF
ncbi:M23 family metallopeptidase [Bacillus sp. CGMCC 1.16541]|uniref:M23 family metallopeptidase n=1 Tax=Bacillus sp. CGMCC 1.16541 TaxID=2185143 RepID=UPI000D73089C|nr:M23 family metallopeptidase [Bacillus sp. CGMCC 1.16541]